MFLPLLRRHTSTVKKQRGEKDEPRYGTSLKNMSSWKGIY